MQNDLCATGDRDRGQLCHTGDLAELALQRGGHGRRHGVWARAGELARHLDGGEVHAGQRGDWQQWIGGQTDQHDGGYQK